MKDCEFSKLFPKLTLFLVTADKWDKRFTRAGVPTRLVGTFESSLDFRRIAPFMDGGTSLYKLLSAKKWWTYGFLF
jgi:hypothetical protein